MGETQRNDPCPCGSGKKYKKCCLNAGKDGFLSKIFSRKKTYIYLTLTIIFFLSIFLRYYGFHQPHGLTFDEGLYAELLAPQLQKDISNYSTQEAYRFHMAQGLQRPLPEYLDQPIFKHPPLYCYLIALNYKLFGTSHLAAVSVSIIFGCLMVLGVFFLGRAFYDNRVGLLAAIILCIEPVHWACSTRMWMETTMSFFMLMAMLFFILGKKQKLYFLASGISIGLAMLIKYPGILPLFVIASFVIFMDRTLLKEKYFWSLCGLSFLVFSPWIIWNAKVYSGFNDAVADPHSLSYHWKSAVSVIREQKWFLMAGLLLIGLYTLTREKIGLLLSDRSENSGGRKQKKLVVGIASIVLIACVIFVPFLRGMVKEAFLWKNEILIGWSNPFSGGPWYFYITRLAELSPFYLFSFLSFFMFFGKDKGDQLLVWTSVLIITAFILLGNYQSRYILPAVPFLVILSARFQVWAFDRLSFRSTEAEKEGSSGVDWNIPRILFLVLCLYFAIKTFKVGWLLGVGPDYGYF